jgi:choline-sulfatase
MHVQKWYPYEESVKVPFVISCPGRIGEGLRDATHLVSGADLMPTFCDYAGIDMPSQSVGMSLRPLLEGRQTEWREYVVAETFRIGRMVRTEQFKYVYYQDDPVEMLFDMKADPWETENLYQQSKYADVMKDHRRLLKEHQARLTPVEPSPRVI